MLANTELNVHLGERLDKSQWLKEQFGGWPTVPVCPGQRDFWDVGLLVLKLVNQDGGHHIQRVLAAAQATEE